MAEHTNALATTEMGPDQEFPARIRVADANLRTGSARRAVTKAGCLFILLLVRAATAQSIGGTPSRITAAPATAAEQAEAAPPDAEAVPILPPKVTYADGQLRIEAHNSTLADVLTKVAALTGVKIDIPAGAKNERMPVVELGPGPARRILASLLSESNFDYLIQAADTDPQKIQQLLLMPREKRGSGTALADAAPRQARSPYARGPAPVSRSEDVPAPENPVPAPPEIVGPEAISLNPQPASTQPEQPTAPAAVQPDQPMQLPLSQPDPSSPAKPGTLAPPANLNPQSINQQLQQMYQQRMQLLQQERQAAPPGAPAK